MARFIYLTKNTTTNEPEIIEPSRNNSILYFKSQGWEEDDDPPEFEIEFESDFDGKWNTQGDNSDDPKGNSGKAGRTWKSSKVGDYQRVKIKLKSSEDHPEEGYKYTIRIGDKELDPRVVPR